jgi:hypothetical protein
MGVEAVVDPVLPAMSRTWVVMGVLVGAPSWLEIFRHPSATISRFASASSTRVRSQHQQTPFRLTFILLPSSLSTSVNMFALSEESKERIAKVIDVARVAIHYGYLPLILYLGMTGPTTTLHMKSATVDIFRTDS